jgi:hypothetical protein
MRRGGVEPACFMVGSTRKTLGTIEAASREQKPSILTLKEGPYTAAPRPPAVYPPFRCRAQGEGGKLNLMRSNTKGPDHC